MRRRIRAFPGDLPLVFPPPLHHLDAAQPQEPAPNFRANYIVQDGIHRRVYMEHDPGKVQNVVVVLEPDLEVGARRGHDYPEREGAER